MVRRSPYSRAARRAARAAENKKAIDIKLYNVSAFSPLAEYYLVATVESSPQADAVADEISDALKGLSGCSSVRREGRSRAPWRILDYGGLVVHVMNSAARGFYGLERLWESARIVKWNTSAGSARRKP
ncbi:MAG: ribosome silencing factor [Elusimicrobia bacterium]|nr:ribosome silencing factor [Elusimicrobiota bacterium]